MLPEPYWQDPDFQLYLGDARELGPQVEPGIVDCVVTSPPYYGLRDYQTGSWVGGDPNCRHLSARKKTRYDYTLANSPIQNGARTGTDARPAIWLPRCGDCGAERVDKQIGLEDDLSVYIRNLVGVFEGLREALTPEATVWVNIGDTYAHTRGYQVPDSKHVDVGNSRPSRVPSGYKVGDMLGVPWRFAFAMQDAGWWLRCDVIWAKPNVMPESVTNRPTKSHEYVFMFAKRPGYFFDQEAVREPHKLDGRTKTTVQAAGGSLQHRDGERWPGNGRNIRSVWEIPTGATSDDHYASFPTELPRRCIKAGCPEGGLVLDPFLGTGTTARVARDLGRRTIGFELSEQYAALSVARLGQLSLFTMLEV